MSTHEHAVSQIGAKPSRIADRLGREAVSSVSEIGEAKKQKKAPSSGNA